MAEHFYLLQFIPGVTFEKVDLAMGIVTGLLLIILAIWGRLALGSGEKAVSPAGKLSVKGVFEGVLEFTIGLSDMVIGEEGRPFVPMFAALFFFIFFHNLFGLVPGLAPATANINMGLALGICSFLMYNYHGLRENGFSYLKHFLGPVIFLAPLMVCIELISHLIRPLTLGLRLMGNILGDHVMIAVFVHMFEKLWFIPVPAIFYGVGLFVAFMQAFVFTMLSMIYVSMAIAHDH